MRSDALANREKVRVAARATIAELGFDLEISDIAEKAGLGAGTVYRHLGRKHEMLCAFVMEVNAAVLANLDAMHSFEDTRDGLAHAIRKGYQLVEVYGRLWLTLMAGGAPAAYATHYDEKRMHATVTNFLERGVANGSLPAHVDPSIAAPLFTAMFAPRPIERILATHTAEEAADVIVRFYLAGLEEIGSREAPQGSVES